MKDLLPSIPVRTMTYLTENSKSQKRGEQFSPLPFHRPPGPRIAPTTTDAWSANALWYTVLFVGCLAMALMAWGAYSALPRSANTENPLHAEQSVPKLKGKVDTAEPPLAEPMQIAASPAPLPSEAEPPLLCEKVELPAPPAVINDVPAPPLPVLPAPQPVKIELPKIVLPPAAPPLPAVAELQKPAIFLDRVNPGDTPMIRTWKALALYSLLAVAPVAAPAPAIAGGGDDKTPKTNDKLEKRLDELVTLMTKAVEGINAVTKGTEDAKTTHLRLRTDLDSAKTRIEDVTKLLDNLQADIKFLQRRAMEANGSPTTDRAGQEDVRKRLALLEDAIAKLRTPDSTSSRVAHSPPSPTGRVVMTNMHFEDILFVINQRSYRLAPGGAITVEAPAGVLIYEAISPTRGLIQPPVNRNLSANETFTLTAR
jgi:hypothetical protein